MNEILIKAVRKILTALIRILLRNGLAYGDFDKIARQCFVDVAFTDFKEPGKKQTISNVSILTGLNRKEVKKLYETDDTQKDQSSQKYNRCIRVIGGWLNDDLFLNEQGLPKDLNIEGKDSFTTLVKKYSGDMPVVAMEKALIKSGNILIRDNRVRLLSHAYLPSDDPSEKITILGSDASELIETIDHNIRADNEHLLFQRKASNIEVDADALPIIKKFLQRKGQTFLEEIDWLLSQHENKTDPDKQRKVSISLFYHDNERDDKK